MKVAAVQMASGPNVSYNLIESSRLIAIAAQAGAGLVVLPENFAINGMSPHDAVKIREIEGKGVIQDFLVDQAAKHGIWIVAGTVPLVATDSNKMRAACLVYNARGQRVARYDKIHAFDVHIQETGETYTESATLEQGDKVVVVETPFGRLGLAICYDLRFPELYRQMLDQGVEIIALPSAFTAITGKAHWETLVRARAIENLSYVIASAQGGYHLNGRETYGHSMVVDPWGVVLDCLPNGSGVAIAEIDRNYLAATRRNFPTTSHRKIKCQ